MARGSHATESSQPRWHATFFAHVPTLSIICLLSALACASVAYYILDRAHGSPTTDWIISPTVYLSILATVARTVLQVAFTNGFTTSWWAKLLTKDGARMNDLHRSWGMAQNPFGALFIPGRSHNVLRAAGLTMTLLVLNGPLLQRSIVVVVQSRQQTTNVTLPVRIQPLWNLTILSSGAGNGWVNSTPPYQAEFGQVVLDQINHAPAQIPAGICDANATCSGAVTVAGFNRNCAISSTSWQEATQKFIGPACTIDYGSYSGCNHSDGLDLAEEYMQTLYQLAVGPTLTGLPYDTFQQSQSGPTTTLALTYEAYIRNDSSSDMLVVQNCTFETAFVQLPVLVTNGTNIAVDTSADVILLPQGAFQGPNVSQIIAGWSQAMRDLFEGYNIWNENESEWYINGVGPRVYTNLMTITPSNQAYSNVSCFDPLNDFSNTLNELTLRYALKAIPTNSARVEEWESNTQFFSEPQLQYSASPNQTVTMSTTQPVAIYTVEYVFLILAMVIMVGAPFVLSPLFIGWWRLGRTFSMSPLEIAKAFDAPILAGVGSNLPGNKIANAVGNRRVKYGEVLEEINGDDATMFARRETYGQGDGKLLVERTTFLATDDVNGHMRVRNILPSLVIAEAASVKPPVNGVVYI